MLDPSALGGSVERLAPHASMIFVQLSSAGYVVISRVILTGGISSTVFLVYQFALATIFMAALAFIFERKCREARKVSPQDLTVYTKFGILTKQKNGAPTARLCTTGADGTIHTSNPTVYSGPGSRSMDQIVPRTS